MNELEKLKEIEIIDRRALDAIKESQRRKYKRSRYEEEICRCYCSNHRSCKIDPRACVILYSNIDSDDDVEYWFDSIVRKIRVSYTRARRYLSQDGGSPVPIRG